MSSCCRTLPGFSYQPLILAERMNSYPSIVLNCYMNFFANRYKSKPRMDVHKRENLEIAFRFMQDVEKIPMVNIGKYTEIDCYMYVN